MTDLRQSYPSDVTDEEWEFCAPYLTLMAESAPQRIYALREVFNALRYFVRAGCPWRLLPHDLPPWRMVHEQASRWQRAGCFEAMAHDLRAILRLAAGRSAQPSAAILDNRTLQSSPESGARAGYDGYKRRNGSRLHAAVAAAAGIRLEVVKLAEAKRGFVLLPKRWVVERSFGWAARFRRLARDYERLAASLENLHWLAFVSLMLTSLFRP